MQSVAIELDRERHALGAALKHEPDGYGREIKAALSPPKVSMQSKRRPGRISIVSRPVQNQLENITHSLALVFATARRAADGAIARCYYSVRIYSSSTFVWLPRLALRLDVVLVQRGGYPMNFRDDLVRPSRFA